MNMSSIINNSNTAFSPKVEVKRRLNKIHISGVSRMPDAHQFYTGLIKNLERYYSEFNQTLIIEFYFEYINSSSTKWLHYLLQRLNKLIVNGGLIEVYWRYDQDDESIELTGDVLKSQVSFPFKLIPVNVAD